MLTIYLSSLSLSFSLPFLILREESVSPRTKLGLDKRDVVLGTSYDK